MKYTNHYRQHGILCSLLVVFWLAYTGSVHAQYNIDINVPDAGVSVDESGVNVSTGDTSITTSGSGTNVQTPGVRVQTGADDTTVQTNSTNVSTNRSGTSLSARLQNNPSVDDASIDLKANGTVLIQTDADVEAYASIASRRNGVEDVMIMSDSVNVHYRDSGKFLGIFPVSYDSEVVVGDDGSVQVKAPWYSFLVFGTKKASIESSVNSDLAGVSITSGASVDKARTVDVVTQNVSVYAGSGASVNTGNVNINSNADGSVDINL